MEENEGSQHAVTTAQTLQADGQARTFSYCHKFLDGKTYMDLQEKILIPLLDDDIAPRFDLVQEVAIVVLDQDQKVLEKKILVLAEASAESLCQLILSEKIDTVICCGIEDEYYQYLMWKKVKVLDYITGSFEAALAHIGKNSPPEMEIFLEN